MSFVLHEQLSFSQLLPAPVSGIPPAEAELFKYLAVSLASAAAS